MPNILIFTNTKENPVSLTLKTLRRNHAIEEKLFTEMDLSEDSREDLCKPDCIVMCLSNQEETSLSEVAMKLKKFVQFKKIDVHVPIIPIVYGVKAENKTSVENNLNTLVKNNQSLNFLKDGLICFETETQEDLIHKLRGTSYQSGYLISPPSGKENLDYSWKDAAIGEAIQIVLLILLGLVIGPIVGGLIGGFAGGGILGASIGIGMGLVVGPLLGVFTAYTLHLKSEKTVAEQRRLALEQQRELTQRNEQWNIFAAGLSPKDSHEVMASFFEDNNFMKTPTQVLQEDFQVSQENSLESSHQKIDNSLHEEQFPSVNQTRPSVF